MNKHDEALALAREAKRIADAATEGPGAPTYMLVTNERNRRFIVHARTAVPALAAAVEELVAEVRRIRTETVEECARVAEGGSFFHDDAPDARFGRECAAAIRRLKDKEPSR